MDFYASEMLSADDAAFIGELLDLCRRHDIGLGRAMEVLDEYVRVKNVKNAAKATTAPDAKG